MSIHAETNNVVMTVMVTHVVCVQQGRCVMRVCVKAVSPLAPIKNAAMMVVGATVALVPMRNPHVPMRDFVWGRASPIVHRRSVAMMVVRARAERALNMKVVRMASAKPSVCPIVF